MPYQMFMILLSFQMQQTQAQTNNHAQLLLILVTMASISSCTTSLLVGAMTSSPTYLSSSAIGCSAYLVTKYQSGENHLYLLTIIASCLCVPFTIASMVTILFKPRFQEWLSLVRQISLSQTKHIILYLCFSGAILMVVIVFCRFVDLIIDATDCLRTHRTQWVWICSFSALTFLLLILAWLLNLVELRKQHQVEEGHNKNTLDQMSFVMHSPYFDNLRNPRQHLKPFLDYEQKKGGEEESDAKSEASKQLKKGLRIIRQGGKRQKNCNLEGQYQSQSSNSSYNQNGKNNKPSKYDHTQQIKNKPHSKRQPQSFKQNQSSKHRPKTISFIIQPKAHRQNQIKEHDRPQTKPKMHIPTTNSKHAHLEKPTENQNRCKDQNMFHENRKHSSQNSSEGKVPGNLPRKQSGGGPPSRFSQQNLTKNHVFQKKKLLPHQNYSQHDVHQAADDSNEWMFNAQNPYSKYLREEQTKKEELEMLIFSHQAAKITEEDARKFIVFENKNSVEKSRKKLFEEEIEQPIPEQALGNRTRNSSFQRHKAGKLDYVRLNPNQQ